MTVGLIKGRHNLPETVTNYIWGGDIKDVTDVIRMEQHAMDWVQIHRPINLTVYVTGLTAALVAVIKACALYKIPLTLMHYNRETKRYFSQRVS